MTNFKLFSYGLLTLLVIKAHAEHSAGYYCLADKDNSDILHIDFQLDKKDDSINYVYAYDQSTSVDMKDCAAEYDSTHGLYHLRVSVNTTSKHQVSPVADCGLVYQGDQYKLKVKALASELVHTGSDRQYTIRCESPTVSQTTGSVSVGSITSVTLPGSNPYIYAYIVSASDLDKLKFTRVGEKVRVKFVLEFSNNKENLDIIGARLINLIAVPTRIFSQPTNRTIIDENGCPVNHSEKALAVNGPFQTSSNGTSPFIAYSPEFEMAYFKVSPYGLVYFQLGIKYCSTTECFQVTCDGSSRKRRSVDPENTVTTTFQVKVENAVISGLTDKSTATSCNSKVTFAVVTTTLLLLIIIQVFIIAYKGQQLSHMKAMVTPSPDHLSLEEVPLHATTYRNPISGGFSSLLDKPDFKHVILK